MEKNNNAIVQVDINQIDGEGEFILTALKNGQHPMDLESRIRDFVEINLYTCSQLIRYLEFKNCYYIGHLYEKDSIILFEILREFKIKSNKFLHLMSYIYKKIEKVLTQVFRQFQDFHYQDFPIASIIVSVLEHPAEPQKVNLKPIVSSWVELTQKIFPESKRNFYEFIDFVLRNLLIVINNEGVVYMMRNKCEVALSNVLRALQGRVQFINDYRSIFQSSVLMINCSFCYKNLEKYEESGQLINRGIIGLEYLEKIMSANGGVLKGFVEKSTYMLALVEFLFNKEDSYFDDITENEHLKLIYFLSIAYKYYSEVIMQEAEFCSEQSKSLYKKFKKSHQRQQKLLNPSQTTDIESDVSLTKMPQKGILKQNQQSSMPFKVKEPQYQQNASNLQNKPVNQQQKEKTSKLTQNILNKNFPENKIQPLEKKQNRNMDDNFSHASFQTVNTNTTLGGGKSFVSKENIIFQKYLSVGQTRYKIVVVQIKEFNCVQLLLYNKPKNFLKKIIIGFTQLLEYAQKTRQDAFANQNSLNSFFEDIGRKLYIENGELKLKQIDSYDTVEQFMKQTRLSNTQTNVENK